MRDGAFPRDVDALFPVAFTGMSLLAARVRSEGFHAVNAAVALGLFCAYVAMLFSRHA